MSEEYDEQAGDESGMPGPGAPTPLTALEVRAFARYKHSQTLTTYL
jgi:hypothetical protein